MLKVYDFFDSIWGLFDDFSNKYILLNAGIYCYLDSASFFKETMQKLLIKNTIMVIDNAISLLNIIKTQQYSTDSPTQRL